MDPNSEVFSTLPPHWNLTDPLSNESIRQGMHMMFATILQKWSSTQSDPTALLLLCLAAVVHQSGWLKKVIHNNPGHPFGNISILQHETLLNKLKDLVTLDAEGHITHPTGIPPHIDQAKMLQKVLNVCKETLHDVQSMANTVKAAVCEAYEEKAIQQGHMTGERLERIMHNYQNELLTAVNARLDELQVIAPGGQANDFQDQADIYDFEMLDGELDNDVHDTQQGQLHYCIYQYDGRYWHTPKDFQFPEGAKLDTGWQRWLSGMPNNVTKAENGSILAAPIRPFRKLKANMLPVGLRSKFSNGWKPIFDMMEKAPGLENLHDSYNHEYITAKFDVAQCFLQTHRMQYVFQNEKYNTNDWRVSQWSKMLRRSSIEKNGTETDKQNLPAATSHHSQSRQQFGRCCHHNTETGHRRVCQRVHQNPVQNEQNQDRLVALAAAAEVQSPVLQD